MIIFITEHPYSFNLNGAAALSSSHLRFLIKKYPHQDIKIIFLNESVNFWKEKPDFDQVKIFLAPITIPEARFSPLSLKSLPLFFTRKIDKLTRGIYKLDESTNRGLVALTQFMTQKTQVDFIWCEHLMPVLYLFLISREESWVKKVIYSHHDFLFKILDIRASSPKHWLRSLLVKKLEAEVLKKISSFVSGSQSELNQISAAAPSVHQTQFLPCFYPSLSPNSLKLPGSIVKIYHLGTAGATANRIGLQFFFKKVFPRIEHLPFVLEFFGNVKDYVLQQFPSLEGHPKIVFHGFVLDLEEKIEAGMIHIIPYAGMTGTRTRIAGLARFKPCLLGFKNMQDSYPFLSSRVNAMVAEDEEAFIKNMETLILDKTLRQKISNNIAEEITNYENNLIKNFKT
jgi:hypothetical protein